MPGRLFTPIKLARGSAEQLWPLESWGPGPSVASCSAPQACISSPLWGAGRGAPGGLGRGSGRLKFPFVFQSSAQHLWTILLQTRPTMVEGHWSSAGENVQKTKQAGRTSPVSFLPLLYLLSHLLFILYSCLSFPFLSPFHGLFIPNYMENTEILLLIIFS